MQDLESIVRTIASIVGILGGLAAFFYWQSKLSDRLRAVERVITRIALYVKEDDIAEKSALVTGSEHFPADREYVTSLDALSSCASTREALNQLCQWGPILHAQRLVRSIVLCLSVMSGLGMIVLLVMTYNLLKDEMESNNLILPPAVLTEIIVQITLAVACVIALPLMLAWAGYGMFVYVNLGRVYYRLFMRTKIVESNPRILKVVHPQDTPELSHIWKES